MKTQQIVATWTESDFRQGWCELDQIGQPVFPNTVGQPISNTDQPAPVTAEPFEPLTRGQRKILTQELSDKLLQLFHANPEAALDGNGAQLNKFIELASKLDERDETRELTALQRLTAGNLRITRTTELYQVLLEMTGTKYIKPELLDEWNQVMVDRLLRR